ncbi:MAG TPA: Asp-tRNA(Asn)/Glu-tRNA(Gln) amidotransferase subunit GatB [Candidatus Methylomirabilis sp.]|nr:Asp-tRNA(Asn)/Glu-tRNA(Gln) amidotransferase subunit GatB [Candidatus Methylomirabilis sp.]
MAEYEAVIGLEVHAELLTESKMFCGCSVKFGAPPNTQTCPVCLGMPGVLPVINRRGVEFAIRTALALNCQIASTSRFARKNYYYPDLPKAYQISQYELPLSMRGHIEFFLNGTKKRVGITRVHMEEDTGKLVHAGVMEEAESSLVDYNRSGVPLMEIVSEPDLRSAEEAAEYLRELRAILVFLGVCDGNMEEGSFRCDANVSVRPRGVDAFGTKVEVKNMNSFKNVQKALEFEIRRQIKAVQEGETLVQETRLWNADQGITLSMRSKEHAHDYRYFPEPDLVPLQVEPAWIEDIRRGLPELPEAKRRRFVAEYGIPEYDAGVLTMSQALADYYEACVRAHADPKVVSNWVMVELLGRLNKDGKDISGSPIPPARLAAMLDLLAKGAISGKMAKQFFDEMYGAGADPAEILKKQGGQITDSAEVEQIIQAILAAHPGPVAECRAGKEGTFNFLVGQVMKATKGKANPKLVNELLKKLLQTQ